MVYILCADRPQYVLLELCCHADVKPSAPMRHKQWGTCCYSLSRWSRFLWQLGILCCSKGDSVSARRVSFSHGLYLSQPAPPRSLTSTDPPRLWEGISRLQTYSLSGNLPQCAWCPGASCLFVCLFFYRTCLRPLCQLDSNLCPAAMAPSSPTTSWRLSCPKRSRICWKISLWAETWCSTSSGSSSTSRGCRSRTPCISTWAPWECFWVPSGGRRTEEVCLFLWHYSQMLEANRNHRLQGVPLQFAGCGCEFADVLHAHTCACLWTWDGARLHSVTQTHQSMAWVM